MNDDNALSETPWERVAERGWGNGPQLERAVKGLKEQVKVLGGDPQDAALYKRVSEQRKTLRRLNVSLRAMENLVAFQEVRLAEQAQKIGDLSGRLAVRGDYASTADEAKEAAWDAGWEAHRQQEVKQLHDPTHAIYRDNPYRS